MNTGTKTERELNKYNLNKFDFEEITRGFEKERQTKVFPVLYHRCIIMPSFQQPIVLDYYEFKSNRNSQMPKNIINIRLGLYEDPFENFNTICPPVAKAFDIEINVGLKIRNYTVENYESQTLNDYLNQIGELSVTQILNEISPLQIDGLSSRFILKSAYKDIMFWAGTTGTGLKLNCLVYGLIKEVLADYDETKSFIEEIERYLER